MKSIRKAVILAAGKGCRLKEIVGNDPKGLLKIGGREIIKRSLDMILSCGIKEIILVTGFSKERYYKALNAEYPFIRYENNDAFGTTGSMHSFFLACNGAVDDVLLLESDLIYEKRCVTHLLTCEKQDVVLISARTDSGDEVYVNGSDGYISHISKTPCNHTPVQGELIGISKLSSSLCQEMCSWYSKQSPFPQDLHYEDGISALSRIRPIHYLKLENAVWAEIDDPQHYKRVMEIVYPKLEGEQI